MLRCRLAVCGRTYVNTIHLYGIAFDSAELAVLLQDELHSMLGMHDIVIHPWWFSSVSPNQLMDEMSCPIIQLFNNSFVRKFDAQHQQCLLCPYWQWQKHLVAVMMAGHAKLGADSPLHSLDIALLEYICKML